MSAQLSIFDLQAGLRARDEAIARLIDRNEDFIETMRSIARIVCRRRGVVSSDDLREIAKDYGIEPGHKNVWGAIFRGKEWVWVGTIHSQIPENHGRMIRTWGLRTTYPIEQAALR